MGGIEAALAEHAFEHLFIECLGWDRFQTVVTVGGNGAQVELTGVAQKRGFAVFVCPSHRTVLANRGLLRDVQRQIRRSHHEHILIHVCETPRKQVWQWAATSVDGRRIRHREHPFFSSEPPPRLLERIQGLNIGFDEEEQTGLTDVLARVRAALAPDSDLNLFARHPSYATESDRLAMAMKYGEPGALNRFVEFHMPLARHSSRMLIRWFGMDPDDAEQTAMIGLIEAARRFDTERGFQFSTYAGYWIRQVCQRFGLEWSQTIRVPPHLFWRCYPLVFAHVRLMATHGVTEGERQFDKELELAEVSRHQWALFCAARHVLFLSEFDRRQREDMDLPEPAPQLEDASTGELRENLRRGLKSLPEREARILCLRYGIDEREHTLQEVGEKLRITRERVRQLQDKAEEKLKRTCLRGGFDGPPAAIAAPAECVESDDHEEEPT